MTTPSDTAHPEGERPPGISFEVGQTIQRWGHEWKVCGIHLGGLKSESLIELAQVSPEAGWTGPWEFHPQLFIPEVLLSAALSQPSRPQGEEGLRETLEALGYQRVFNAIGDAVEWQPHRSFGISVAKFIAALSNQGKPSS